MSSDDKNKEEKGSFSATPRKFFLPKDLHNATPEKIWSWWQEKRLQEGLLKNAIVSGKVSTSNDMTTQDFKYFMIFGDKINYEISYIRVSKI